MALLAVICLLRARIHRRGSLTGDADLAAALEPVVGRRVRRLTAVSLDCGSEQRTRMAFVDADVTTRWELGSISKAFTGLLVAQLVEAEQLTLDSTLREIAPGYTGTPVGQATVAQLCTHTSGLPRLPRGPRPVLPALGSLLFGMNPYARSSPERVARAAGRQRLGRVGAYDYSNLATTALGNALARRAGTDFASMLRERVLVPLGMSQTTADPGARAVARGWTKHGRRSFRWRLGGYAPAGGLVSTAADMAAFAEALLADRCGFGTARRPIPGVEVPWAESAQGMFWIVTTPGGGTRTRVWHNGQTGGYSSYLAIYPQSGRAVVVLADTADAAAQQRVAAGIAEWMRTRPSGAGPAA